MTEPIEYNEDGSMRNPRDLTQEEYDSTYAHGTGGHEVPDDVWPSDTFEPGAVDG